VTEEPTVTTDPVNTDTDPDSTDPDSTGAGPSPADLGFAGCVEELERIVRGLEADTIDVDHLAAAVERATALVEWCRDKLGDTRLRLDEVLPRLESGGPDPAGGAGDGNGEGDGGTAAGPSDGPGANG
jgi:exodeoxyribonuclease VII small subunit